MNPRVQFRQVGGAKVGFGGGLLLLLLGIVTLVGVLLSTLVLSLLLAPVRLLLRARRPKANLPPAEAPLARTGTDPEWRPGTAIDATYEEVP
ncbi:MAG: hypothetical protein IPK72_14770 [Candidatus Eisenbacteria bacterium]|nr:hypothetical protein [Candidatus Eisenbacteria bacterium]